MPEPLLILAQLFYVFNVVTFVIVLRPDLVAWLDERDAKNPRLRRDEGSES